MNPVRTERLTVRKFASDDPMLAYGHPVDQWNMAVAYSPELADRYYAEYPLPGGGWFAVCFNATGEILGRVGLLSRGDLYEPPEIELTYGLAEQYRGYGYATEACRAILGYAINQLHLPRLFAGVHVDNRASQGVAESLGLTYEYTVEWYGETHRMYWYRKNPEKTERPRPSATQPTFPVAVGQEGIQPG